MRIRRLLAFRRPDWLRVSALLLSLGLLSACSPDAEDPKAPEKAEPSEATPTSVEETEAPSAPGSPIPPAELSTDTGSGNADPPAVAVGPLRANVDPLAEVRVALITFLDGATWRERLPVTYQADQLEDRIAAHYGDGKYPDGPVNRYDLEFFHLDKSTEDGGPYYIFFVTAPDNPEGFPVIVRGTAEGYKVDWECFAEFHHKHFTAFHDSGAAGPRDFRVVLKRSDYRGPDRRHFTDLDKFLCYRVDLPYVDTDFYAFVEKDDPLAASVREKVSWETPPLAAIVRFRREEFTHGERHLKIVALVADGWHRDTSSLTSRILEQLRKDVAREPDNAEAWYQLGTALLESGELKEAERALVEAIELDPEFAMAHNGLGFTLLQQGMPDRAIESCRRAIELDPEYAMAHNNLGVALAQQGKQDEAIEFFRRAIEIDPEFAMAHNSLGVALAEQGKLDEAIASFRRAIEFDPEYAEAHNGLGFALLQQGMPDQAIESFLRSIQLNPDYARAHGNFGLALTQQGRLGQVDRCGVWLARFVLAKGVADEAALIQQMPLGFRRIKVELPTETPSEEAIQDYYQAHAEAFGTSAVHLRTVSLPKGKTTREIAEALRDKLVAGDGEDFAAAAKQHSDDLAAEDGGDRGWVKPGDLRADLIDAAFALKAGEISAVIEDDSHYRILNTVEHRGGTPPPLEEVREQIVTKLIEEAQATRIKGWIEQARKEHAEAMDGA